MAGNLISFDPSTFVEGGLPDDLDVVWKEIQWCAYDYDGSVPEPVLALGIKMTYPDPDQPGKVKEVDQYYSAGDLAFFVPSADGFSLVQAEGSGKSALNTNTNAAKLITSLMVASQGAVQQILASGSVQGLVGLQCHMKRMAQPKRSGIVRTGKNANREATILLVERVIAMPGQAAPPSTPAQNPAGLKKGLGGGAKVTPLANTPAGMPGQAAPVAAPPVQAAPPANGQIDELAMSALMEVVINAGGSIAKAVLPAKVFQSEALKPHAALKPKVVQRVFEDAFLSAVPGFRYDGANVALAE